MLQGGYLPRVTAVEIGHDRVVHVRFDDGFEGELDLAPHLWGSAFDAVRDDDAMFAQIAIEGDGVAWPGAGDMAPEYLYVEIKARHAGVTPSSR